MKTIALMIICSSLFISYGDLGKRRPRRRARADKRQGVHTEQGIDLRKFQQCLNPARIAHCGIPRF